MQAIRFFNNSGPVNDADHFCVSPIKRLDTAKVWQLILQKKYFLICGPKQSGKTSYLLALAKVINRNGNAKCLYFNVESLRGVQENLEECMRCILFEISARARDTFGDDYLEDHVSNILQKRGPYQALNELLTQWSKRSDKPIVLLIDEIDTLQGAILTSVLSQIRAGYDKRPVFFPQSIVFCATHDVIDKQFNIKDAALRINFLHREDLDSMFSAYSAKHSIEIDKNVVDRIWRYSSGQPWIVSTLAGEIFHEIVPAKGINAVSVNQVDEAIDNILAKKGNHIDYLASQLRDEKVKKFLIPILTSGSMVDSGGELDFTYVQELGLIKAEGKVDFSNSLYKELVPRVLFDPIYCMINLDIDDYLREDDSFDASKLMRSFQAFFRNHIDRLVALIDYGAAGYGLVFQALLQKLAGAAASVEREYGIGLGRQTLRLRFSYPNRQEILFILKPIVLWSIDEYKQRVAQLGNEAAEVAAANPKCSEVHVAAININPEYQWFDKVPYARRDSVGMPIHVWGF